ncbi:hypothetical protein [Nitrospirillum viridazoti]|uniref:EamA-like transporter family protein n=1 Tax=Nitrospirillum amazonense TaxID=28077 RepID=A0A560IBG9_9PROT|nr:hypothetical protein [Nitrospirillum amazonense]TWB56397.1 hypothetical protein FBZ92_1112 [Nitrospirillum amazonense]
MGRIDLILCVIFSLCLPAGQILFKMAARHGQANGGFSILDVVRNPLLIAAFAFYGATAVLWYRILTVLPLSRAYIFSLVGSALVPAAGYVIFGEKMTLQYIIGASFIIIGFFIAFRA